MENCILHPKYILMHWIDGYCKIYVVVVFAITTVISCHSWPCNLLFGIERCSCDVGLLSPRTTRTHFRYLKNSYPEQYSNWQQYICYICMLHLILLFFIKFIKTHRSFYIVSLHSQFQSLLVPIYFDLNLLLSFC